MDTQANLMVIIGSNVGPFYDEWLKCLHTELIPSLKELPIDRLPQLIAQKLRIVPHPYNNDGLDQLTERLRSYTVISEDYPHQQRQEDIATWIFRLSENDNWSTAEVHDTLIDLLKQQMLPVHDYDISGTR